MVATSDALTFVYLTSHGQPRGFQIDNNEIMEYDKLLAETEKIAGKKVLVTLACYSGSLLEALAETAGKQNYIAVTSAAATEKGVNFGEDVLHDELVEHLLKRQLLSHFKVPKVLREGDLLDMHHPQIFGVYDVQL